MVRNPFWRRSLLPRRPANVDRVEFTYGLSPEATRGRLERNETDVGPISSQDVPEIHRRHGLRGRFRVLPRMHVNYLFFNHRRPLFRGNVRLKRAVNFALDRPQLARQFGFLAGRRTDQILPPLMPGFRDQRLYPLAGADVARGRALARGQLRGGKGRALRPHLVRLDRRLRRSVELRGPALRRAHDPPGWPSFQLRLL